MNKNFNCLFSTLSKDITLNNTDNINNSERLFVGLYAYSEALKSCSKITAIVDADTVTLNELPIKDGSFDTVFSDMPPFKYLELCEALKDVQQIVNSNGVFIQLKLRNENQITRDKLNGIKTKQRDSYIKIKAHPFIFSPTIDQIEKAGFMEKQDVIVWLSRKDCIDKGIEFNDFDEIRDTIIIDDVVYKINDKNKNFQIGNEFLYFVLGLRKK
jgi:hypothetical protein